jgi:Chitobiase/beta-hexosaminidase C-terminal domain
MSFLTQLQQQCADRLQADPLFAHVRVLTERITDIESEIERALGPLNETGGKTGAVVIVLTPTANVNFENVFGPFFDEIKVVARVIENVPVNQDPATGTNAAAAELAERICGLLHHFQPENAAGPLVAQRPSIALANEPRHLSYDCVFKTSGGLTETLPQVATPGVLINAGVVTLSCATAGAAIFYTLDGRNPGPRTGTLYTAPFSPGAGVAVKARGWLAGYLASETVGVTT